MPEYVLQCQNCATKYATQRSIHDDSDWPQCPTCDSIDVRIFYTPPGIVFKGDGWAGKTK